MPFLTGHQKFDGLQMLNYRRQEFIVTVLLDVLIHAVDGSVDPVLFRY